MAITVNSGHQTLADASNTTSHPVPVPSHSVGDAVYIAILCDGSQAFTFPAGFSKLIADTVTNSTATLAVARKVVTGSTDSGTYSVTTSGSERAVAISWSQSGDDGVDGTTPTPNTGSSATATAPAVTTTVANALILRIVGTDGDSTAHSTLSSYTKITEVTGASAGTVSVQWIVQSSSGSSGTADIGITTEQWAAATIAIAPAASSVHDLTAIAITTAAPSVGAPVLGQIHALTAVAITTGAPVLAAPVLGQIHALTAVAITTGAPTLAAPVLGSGAHGLTAVAITTGAPVLAAPVLGQIHALTAVAITTGAPTLAAPALSTPQPLTSIVIGHNARILIADPNRKIIAECQFAMDPISWMVNDYGTTKLVAARTDPAATEENLRPGNWLYVELDNGLPPWAGVMQPAPRFTSSSIEMDVTSAEHYLKRFHTDKGRYFNKSTAGNIVASVIGEANAAWGMGVAIGEMWGGGTLHSPEYHLQSVWNIITESVVGRMEDCEFRIDPSLRNGRIELTAHLTQRRGVVRPNVWLIQGHNLTQDVYTGSDELVNHWLLAGDNLTGDTDGWGDGRLLDMETGRNEESIGVHGLWQSPLIDQNITEQATLSEYARYLIGETATPRIMVCGSTFNLAPAMFKDYTVGDTVRIIAALATFGPLDTMIRVVGRAFGLSDGVCRLALQNV